MHGKRNVPDRYLLAAEPSRHSDSNPLHMKTHTIMKQYNIITAKEGGITEFWRTLNHQKTHGSSDVCVGLLRCAEGCWGVLRGCPVPPQRFEMFTCCPVHAMLFLLHSGIVQQLPCQHSRTESVLVRHIIGHYYLLRPSGIEQNSIVGLWRILFTLIKRL